MTAETEFAQSLATLPAQSLKRVDLTLFNQDPSNQNFILPSALMPFNPPTDHLSLALHALSQSPNLTDLSLKGDIVLSPCFFWPDNYDPSTIAPFWPRLEELDVWLNITTPSGDWLYVRDPSEFVHGPGVAPPLAEFELEEEEDGSTHSTDSDSSIPENYHSPLNEYLDGRSPSDRFRTILDGDRLHPMLMAMARAAADDRMPAMHRIALHLNTNSLGGLEVECLVDGAPTTESRQEAETTTLSSSSLSRPCKRWQVSIGLEAKWTPPEDLQAAWKKSARGETRAKNGINGSADDDEGLVTIEYY